MHSAIYEGEVMHHRLAPKTYQFRHRVFYLWLDLDELDALDRGLALLKRNRAGLFAFHDHDHLDRGQGSARANVLLTLQEAGVDTARIDRVRLLTFPRVLGHIFNPVCFYFAFDADGAPLAAVAEVTNTFYEQKAYVLDRLEDGRFRLDTPKHFYVSPFFGLEVRFDFQLSVPGDSLDLIVDDRDGGDRVLHTRLTGRRRELTDAALLSCFLRHPLLTLRVLFLIHWHAFRLWRMRLPFLHKRDRPDLQRDVHRPHPSLTAP